MAHISPVNSSVQPLEPITNSKNCAATTLLISGIAIGILAIAIGGLSLQAGVTGSSSAFLHSFTFLGKEEALVLMGAGTVASVALILLSAHFRKENEGEEDNEEDFVQSFEINQKPSLGRQEHVEAYSEWVGMSRNEIRAVGGYQFTQFAGTQEIRDEFVDFANSMTRAQVGTEAQAGEECVQQPLPCSAGIQNISENSSQGNDFHFLIGEAERLYPILPCPDERVIIRKAKVMNASLIGKQVGLMAKGLTKAEVEVVLGQQPITLSRNSEYAANFKRLKGQELFDFLHVAGDHREMSDCLLRALHQSRRENAVSAFATYYAHEIIWMKKLQKREEIDPEYQKTFLQDPINTTREIGLNLVQGEANNDVLLYTLTLAPSLYDDLGRLMFYTIKGCEVTHADPRCMASAVALNVTTALLMRGYQDVDQIMYIAGEIAEESLRAEAQENSLPMDALSQCIEQLHAHMSGNFDTLALDENSPERPINFTYKCLGAAYLSLRAASALRKKGKSHEEIFQTVIETLARQGGDAQSNCAVSAALVTALLDACGPGRIFPQNWKEALFSRNAL